MKIILQNYSVIEKHFYAVNKVKEVRKVKTAV